MNNLAIEIKSMTTVEIAELTGKDHDKVKRDFNSQCEGLNISPAKFGESYLASNGHEYSCYRLPKHECMVLVSGYSVVMRDKIIRRWQVLENINQSSPKIEITGTTTASVDFKALQEIALLTGLDHNESCIRANIAVRNDYGVDLLAKIGQTHLIAAKQEVLLTPTDIEKRMGWKSREGNRKLLNAKLQDAHRDHKGRVYYTVRPEGVNYAKLLDTGKKRSNGTSVVQIKWYESVLDELKQPIC